MAGVRVGEATRSVDALKRLRAYFRTGAAQRQALDARSTVAEVVARIRSGAQQGDVRLTLVAEPNLPRIYADPLQLSVILQNLIGNAIDAAAAAGAGLGKVSVNVRNEGDSVTFHIDDNGPGVAECVRGQLFQSVESRKPTGMGLGLAISRSLVASNQGRIWLESSSDAGASFAFAIPAVAAATTEEST